MVLRIADAINEFAQYSKGTGLAAGTVDRHAKAIRVFYRKCQQIKGPNPTMGQIDHQCISKLFAELAGSQGNRNNYIESMGKFLAWAERFGYLRPGFTAAGLMDGYRTRKAVRKPKLYLEPEQFSEALETAGERSPRERAIIALAIYTLARQSEISVMQLKDLDLENRTLMVYRQKLKRYTETGITPELYGELLSWLEVYADITGHPSVAQMVRRNPEWYLIPAQPRGPWREVMFPERPTGLMERVAKRILVAMDITPPPGEGMHTWRRSGARAMFKFLRDSMGWDGALIRVQAMLDHDSPQMTLKYIGMDQEKDELNDWLKSNSMYGTAPKGAKVIPFRRAV